MEMNVRVLFILATMFVAACSEFGYQRSEITEVYVEDFGSDDMASCRPSDVDLNNHEAQEFFIRSKQVEHKVLHDHYIYAPCYIEGTLKYGKDVCEWEIRAGATGHIKCGGNYMYYACDNCDDLFRPKQTMNK